MFLTVFNVHQLFSAKVVSKCDGFHRIGTSKSKFSSGGAEGIVFRLSENKS
jgi:hypothetical protein